MMPRIETVPENSAMLLVNYFGLIPDKKIEIMRSCNCHIILDNTQAFYHRPKAGLDTFYSCRKFFGVPDGSYMYAEGITQDGLDVELSGKKMEWLLGRYEKNAASYYTAYREHEDAAATAVPKAMSKITRNLLKAIDYEFVRVRREQNYNFLEEQLGGTNRLQVKMPSAPFTYPLMVKDGIEVRAALCNMRIYVPTLWGNVLTSVPTSTVEYDFAANIIPLPIDQRYDLDDMSHIVNSVRRFLK
jgi:hypothetical protein